MSLADCYREYASHLQFYALPEQFLWQIQFRESRVFREFAIPRPLVEASYERRLQAILVLKDISVAT